MEFLIFNPNVLIVFLYLNSWSHLQGPFLSMGKYSICLYIPKIKLHFYHVSILELMFVYGRKSILHFFPHGQLFLCYLLKCVFFLF